MHGHRVSLELLEVVPSWEIVGCLIDSAPGTLLSNLSNNDSKTGDVKFLAYFIHHGLAISMCEPSMIRRDEQPREVVVLW